MAEVTKTYQYKIGDNTFSVDVTVDIPDFCDHFPGTDGHTVGKKTISIYLSDPVPFNLFIYLQTTRRRNDQYGHSEDTYMLIRSIPADETYEFFEWPCYDYVINHDAGTFSEETWDYVFADQTTVQVGAGPLESVV